MTACYLLIVMFALFLIAYWDIKTHLITNDELKGFLVLSLASILFIPITSIKQFFIYSIFGAISVSLFMFLIDCITHKKSGLYAFGFGDVKLFFLLGFIFGPVDIWLIFAVSLFFSVIGYFIHKITNKTNKKEKIPLGPYIFLGTSLFIVLSYI